MEEIEGDIL